MFLLHTGLLSPREVKQPGQGHPASDRKGVTVSFLMMTIIGLFRDVTLHLLEIWSVYGS